MVGGEAAAAVEELVSGVRQAADFAEQFRTYSESEKQWKARMEFILRHLPDYRDPPDGSGRLDQLLSLSMVWANHLFLGCSYNKDLLDKVMEMADGIEVEDLPQFTTRSELMKKIVTFLRKAIESMVLHCVTFRKLKQMHHSFTDEKAWIVTTVCNSMRAQPGPTEPDFSRMSAERAAAPGPQIPVPVGPP
ncbi:PREDICTED: CDKN2AIP N-terminal-like protein [Elephantulus edwardii]|uniref:CDKN2AIP N-terminal-like protein n=1 Tax=Elephantulus edwardii TaxID=28737 RepID=UPI0003F0DA3B|nr:PREDICTED: CDKN2AIP N-terminal-like protein [Elephantulus edwardii]